MGKKIQGCRFKRTEEAIFDAFFANKKIPTPGLLAKRARISRSTLFRHYRTVHDIVPSYERRIYCRYVKRIEKILKKEQIKTRDIYLNFLIFVVANKKEFKLILAHKDSVIFEKMIWRLENRICDSYFLPQNSKQVFGIYTKEIVGLLEEWGKRDFNKNEIESVLKNIMYLTETIKVRLVPILRN